MLSSPPPTAKSPSACIQLIVLINVAIPYPPQGNRHNHNTCTNQPKYNNTIQEAYHQPTHRELAVTWTSKMKAYLNPHIPKHASTHSVSVHICCRASFVAKNQNMHKIGKEFQRWGTKTKKTLFRVIGYHLTLKVGASWDSGPPENNDVGMFM